MTEMQIALNERIVREAAARVEAAGYKGDAHRFVESLLLNCYADGWRPVERPPALRPDTIAPPDSPGRRAFAAARKNLANRQKEAH